MEESKSTTFNIENKIYNKQFYKNNSVIQQGKKWVIVKRGWFSLSKTNFKQLEQLFSKTLNQLLESKDRVSPESLNKSKNALNNAKELYQANPSDSLRALIEKSEISLLILLLTVKANELSEIAREEKATQAFIEELTPQTVKDNELSDIDKYISSFLHPYITGQITRETDPKDRIPMMEALIDHIGRDKYLELKPNEKQCLDQYALELFFEKVAQGLYINRTVNWRGSMGRRLFSRPTDYEIQPSGRVFNVLVNALVDAIPREFPQAKMPKAQIRKKAEEALQKVNKMRETAREEALEILHSESEKQYDPSKALRKQEAKLRIFKRHNILFTQDIDELLKDENQEKRNKGLRIKKELDATFEMIDLLG